MKVDPLAPAVACALVLTACATASRVQHPGAAIESRVPVGDASLYTRTIGQGRGMVVLHGGPDFDIAYLLPELDQVLGDSFRLIYYDQRGRGKSAENVRPDDVTLASDLDDIDAVRQHFGLAAPVLLGHSWGAVLALEYALRHPDRVSHLVLMNPAPVATSDVALLRKSYLAKLGDAMQAQRDIVNSAPYQEGDPEAVAARYRIHFTHALTRREHYETLMAKMKAAFALQGREGIVKARAVEERLKRDTWAIPSYDLVPKLRELRIPTLVIVGADDFIPPEIAARIAGAIPGAVLVNIPACGHFSYLECPGAVRAAVDRFFENTSPAR